MKIYILRKTRFSIDKAMYFFGKIEVLYFLEGFGTTV